MIPRILPQGPGSSSSDRTAEERRALQWLRLRFHEDRDLWTARELAHLRFMRWLAQTGRLAEDDGPTWSDAEQRCA